ncbi:hypothetical protein LZ31DRAFT_142538 [Colletotrichum somersetense]|nr:hypothetical protein LZ31DRAFT_142538 [Colletotrichum somersetense]
MCPCRNARLGKHTRHKWDTHDSPLLCGFIALLSHASLSTARAKNTCRKPHEPVPQTSDVSAALATVLSVFSSAERHPQLPSTNRVVLRCRHQESYARRTSLLGRVAFVVIQLLGYRSMRNCTDPISQPYGLWNPITRWA